MSDANPLVIAVRVEDSMLADRLAELLGSIEGFRIAKENEPADLVLSSVREEFEDAILTVREREVVTLLAQGMSNKEIARHLGIALDTAKFHVGRVIDKLDANGRTDAVAHAARLGVIHL